MARSRQSRPPGPTGHTGPSAAPPALTRPAKLLPGPRNLGSPHTLVSQLWRSHPQNHHENQHTARGLGRNRRKNTLLSSQTDGFPRIPRRSSELTSHQSLKPQAARFLGFPGAQRVKRLPAVQPTPVFLPGESHGQRSLEGYSPRGGKELGTTERLTR